MASYWTYSIEDRHFTVTRRYTFHPVEQWEAVDQHGVWGLGGSVIEACEAAFAYKGTAEQQWRQEEPTPGATYMAFPCEADGYVTIMEVPHNPASAPTYRIFPL